jgi:hypothetical protein
MSVDWGPIVADALTRFRPSHRHANARTVGRLERLPKWLNLIPMVSQWLWLSLLYRSASLPTTVNPAILAGGLVGEGKLDYFETMGPHALAHTAAFTSIVNQGPAGMSAALAAMSAAGLAYPIIAKPDIGWCGFGVRLVRNDVELKAYLCLFPRGERIILQRFVSHEGEAGLYYVRRPGETKGRLSGILLRHFPRVQGDGASSIADLIAANPRLCRLGRDGLSEPCCDVADIPAAGKIVRLSTIGSTRVGGLYEDATPIITAGMTDALDAIAQDMTDFHVGRFDVRYDTLDLLRAGEFTIIEVNGAGSEAVHAWDPKFTLREAYAIVFAKQRMLFEIGDTMRRRGHRPIGLRKLAELHVRQQRLIKRYPMSN